MNVRVHAETDIESDCHALDEPLEMENGDDKLLVAGRTAPATDKLSRVLHRIVPRGELGTLIVTKCSAAIVYPDQPSC